MSYNLIMTVKEEKEEEEEEEKHEEEEEQQKRRIVDLPEKFVVRQEYLLIHLHYQ